MILENETVKILNSNCPQKLRPSLENLQFIYLFISYRTVDNESYLVLAIKHQLQSLVKCLCEKGVDLGTPDTNGNVPLWVALRSKQENIASMLVCHVSTILHTCKMFLY